VAGLDRVIDVRPLRAEDADAITALARRRRQLGDAWDEPDQDSAVQVASLDDRVAGAGWAEWWDEADGTHLYLLLGFVDPALRGRGVGRALLREQEDWARQHARDRGIEAVTFGGNADAGRPRAQELLGDLGYEVAFTVLELERLMTLDVAIPPVVPAYDVLPMREDHHREAHDLIEAAFGTSRLGAMPRAFDDYLDEVATASSGLDLWRVAWHGDRLAGVAVNVLEDGVFETPWLAVAQEHRGRGLGEWLMRESLAAAAAHGAQVARLSTIAENPYGSVALYERVGYRVVARRPRYRKSEP
jgi:mycothiol synthase